MCIPATYVVFKGFSITGPQDCGDAPWNWGSPCSGICRSHVCYPLGQHTWFLFTPGHGAPKAGLQKPHPGVPVHQDLYKPLKRLSLTAHVVLYARPSPQCLRDWAAAAQSQGPHALGPIKLCVPPSQKVWFLLIRRHGDPRINPIPRSPCAGSQGPCAQGWLKTTRAPQLEF